MFYKHNGQFEIVWSSSFRYIVKSPKHGAVIYSKHLKAQTLSHWACMKSSTVT